MRSRSWLLLALASCGEVGSQATLTVELTGGGTVTSTPAGIACPGTCSAEFDFDDEITLAATPDAASSFTGWSDRCPGRGSCVLTLDAAEIAVDARFAPQGAKRWLVTAGVPQDFISGLAVAAVGADVVLVGDAGIAAPIGGMQLAAPGVFVARFAADTGQVSFAKTLGDMTVAASAVDAAGNVVLVGNFMGSIDFGGGPIASRGESDGYIAKYTAEGAYQWAMQIGGAGYDRVEAAGIDASGEVFASGTFAGTVDFGAGPVTAAGPVTTHDIFVARYSSAGAYVWVRRFGNDAPESVSGLAVDRDGAIVLGGTFTGTVAFDTDTLQAIDTSGGVIAKLEPGAGVVRFARKIGSGTSLLTTDREGNVLFTGSKPMDADVGGTPIPGQFFAAKYSPAGAHIWSRGFIASPRSIAADSFGDAVLGGGFSSTFDVGNGVVLTSAGNQDGFVAKLRGDTGATAWAKRFGGTQFENTNGVSVDALDRISVAGAFGGFSEFDGEQVNALGIADLFVISLEP